MSDVDRWIVLNADGSIVSEFSNVGRISIADDFITVYSNEEAGQHGTIIGIVPLRKFIFKKSRN